MSAIFRHSLKGKAVLTSCQANAAIASLRVWINGPARDPFRVTPGAGLSKSAKGSGS